MIRVYHGQRVVLGCARADRSLWVVYVATGGGVVMSRTLWDSLPLAGAQ